MDDLDRAQVVSDLALELALKEQRMRSMPLSHSATCCKDCAEPIPEARRVAIPGCTRCVECQAKQERRPEPRSHIWRE